MSILVPILCNFIKYNCCWRLYWFRVAPNKIKEVYGIFKAYVTRVGSGPFPTELLTKMVRMARVGNEFGSVTGRQRRCGWLDLVALKYAVQVNGVTQLMKGDVLSGFETLKGVHRIQL
jgi:adenylosuccinate synthase